MVAEGEYKYKRYSYTRERTKTGICTEESTRDDNSYRIRLEVTQRKMREMVVERRRAPRKVVARRSEPDKVVAKRSAMCIADGILARRSLPEEVVAERRPSKRPHQRFRIAS